jgi:hypothetical protein
MVLVFIASSCFFFFASPVFERIERYKSLGKPFIRWAIGLLCQRSRLRVKRSGVCRVWPSSHIIGNCEMWFDASEETFERREREIAQRTRSLRGVALMGTPTTYAPPVARAPRNDYASQTAWEMNEIQVTMRTMTLRGESFRGSRTNSYPPADYPPARAPRIYDASETAIAIRERELAMRQQTLRGAELRGNQSTCCCPTAREPRIGDRVRIDLDCVGPRNGVIIDITPCFLIIKVRGMPKPFRRAPHNVTFL